MQTVSQLPILRNIEVFNQATLVIPISLGFNTAGMTVYAYALWSQGSQQLPVTVVSSATGSITVTVPPTLPAVSGMTWRLETYEVSAEDPANARRTRMWGAVNIVTPSSLSPDSPLYLKVEMAAGDEYTFQVNLGVNISGKTLYAGALYTDETGTVGRSLPVSVTSASTGIVRVTVPEAVSFGIANDGNATWSLFSPGAVALSQDVYRAGPIVCYLNPTGGAGAAAAAPAQLGSVFL